MSANHNLKNRNMHAQTLKNSWQKMHLWPLLIVKAQSKGYEKPKQM
jgi:hypothetical protein